MTGSLPADTPMYCYAYHTPGSLDNVSQVMWFLRLLFYPLKFFIFQAPPSFPSLCFCHGPPGWTDPGILGGDRISPPAWSHCLMPLQHCCRQHTWPAPYMKNNSLIFSKASLIYADEGLAPCPVSSAELFSTFPGSR